MALPMPGSPTKSPTPINASINGNDAPVSMFFFSLMFQLAGLKFFYPASLFLVSFNIYA
jgi:hypothetical protein